jgi:hypothetical protein
VCGDGSIGVEAIMEKILLGSKLEVRRKKRQEDAATVEISA